MTSSRSSLPPPPAPLRAVPRRRLGDRPEEPAVAVPAPPPAGSAARGGGRPGAPELPPIARLPRAAPLPASLYQQWAWESLGSDAAKLNLSFAVPFDGPLSPPVLLAALRELERRQEALRIRLVPAAGQPGKVGLAIDPPGRLELPWIDLSALPGGRRGGELGRFAGEDVLRPLDPARPMVRVRCVRLAPDHHAVMINLGHLVSDGWSMELVRFELSALYEAFAAGRPSPLPELAVQFVDFAAWQRGIAAGAVAARQLGYWRERLADLPLPLVLPGDFPYHPKLGPGVHQAACRFSAAETARLRGLARAQGSTTAMVALTALGLLLSAYTGETDIVIDAKVLGRPRPELAAIVGMFMSAVIHRTDLAGQPSFEEALRRTRDGVLEDYCNQDVPFPQLIQELFPGQVHLARVTFNMLSFPTQRPIASLDQEGGIYARDERAPDREIARCDLMVLGLEDRDRLRLDVVGAASRFQLATVEEIAGDLKQVLLRAPGEPEVPFARLLPEPRYRHARATSRLG